MIDLGDRESVLSSRIDLTGLFVPRYGYMSGFAGLSARPDSSAFDIVLSEGAFLSVDTRTHEVTRQYTRGAFVSNWDTYMPRMPMSPMAWDASAQLFASVDSSGAFEIRRGIAGPLVTRIDVPETSSLQERENAEIRTARWTPRHSVLRRWSDDRGGVQEWGGSMGAAKARSLFPRRRPIWRRSPFRCPPRCARGTWWISK